MEDKPAGQRLRAARKRAGFSTIAAFADVLSTYGLTYTDEAIGHWETGRRRPYTHDEDRPNALTLLRVLVDNGGIDDLAEINDILAAFDRPPVSARERTAYFPTLAAVPSIENLPEQPPYDRLIGRDDTLKAVITEILNPTGKWLVSISGLGGIGKTALAYETVKQIMISSRFEKLVWETAKSEELIGSRVQHRRKRPLQFTEILAGYARQLGLEALSTRPPEILISGLTQAFRSGNVLIVLDNLESLEAAQEVARELYGMVSPGRSRVLITSRERLADEAFVADFYLKGLSEAESTTLLLGEAKARHAEALLHAAPDVGKRVYESTGGMPLAIKLIVRQSILGIAIDDELRRISEAADEEELYHFIYEALWEKLSGRAHRLLIAAATYATAVLRSMLQPVSELTDSEFHQAVIELVRASLLEVTPHVLAAQQQYDIHPMTRWFVTGPFADLWAKSNF